MDSDHEKALACLKMWASTETPLELSCNDTRSAEQAAASPGIVVFESDDALRFTWATDMPTYSPDPMINSAGVMKISIKDKKLTISGLADPQGSITEPITDPTVWVYIGLYQEAFSCKFRAADLIAAKRFRDSLNQRTLL